MPLPPIAVDVAPPSKDQALVQMLLDACSRAASPVKCVSAESVDTGNVSALALVVWFSDAEGVRIQVGAKRGEQKGDWVSRQISFDAEDEEGERWTTAGFVVGTLAGRFLDVPATKPEPSVEPSAVAPAAAVTSPEPAAAAPPEPEPEPESTARTAARFGVEAAVLVGPVLDQGPWRVGGMFGLAYQGQGWPLFLYGAARQSWRPEDAGVALRVTDAEVGGGVALGSGPRWAVKARGAFAFERLYARFDGSLSNGPQTEWVLGARARVDFCFRFNDAWSVFFAPGLSVWSHKTAFMVGTDQVGQQSSLVGEALLGLFFDVPIGP